jgi:putative phosphoribosyl transferase
MAVPHHLWPDRWTAGIALAERLQRWRDGSDTTTVIGLPRGGVAVAAAVAQQLHLPLRCWAVRKLASPEEPEFALGAIASGGSVVWNPAAMARTPLSRVEQERLIAAAMPELLRRQRLFGEARPTDLCGRDVIVVDDGIATGMTVRAALLALRRSQPAHLVLAVPVVDAELVDALRPLVDELVAVIAVPGLYAVGAFYDDFDQLSDADVQALLGLRPEA